MNIRAAILKDKIYKKEQAATITDYACSSPEHFKELMYCFTSNEYRLAQRAAWSVSDAANKKPELIEPYLKEIVQLMQRTDVHTAVVRNGMRILQAIAIPEALHGEVMNVCFSFIEKRATPVAIKAFALTTLHNLSNHYPEIKPELKLIIEEHINNETAAFVSRGRKILKQLQKCKTPRI